MHIEHVHSAPAPASPPPSFTPAAAQSNACFGFGAGAAAVAVTEPGRSASHTAHFVAEGSLFLSIHSEHSHVDASGALIPAAAQSNAFGGAGLDVDATGIGASKSN